MEAVDDQAEREERERKRALLCLIRNHCKFLRKCTGSIHILTVTLQSEWFDGNGESE